uniref:Trafficking protein particle complex subunit n=1 Tax=Cairina moschata TaxID=8855 RepID=A0A8C3CHC2_CAIMO
MGGTLNLGEGPQKYGGAPPGKHRETAGDGKGALGDTGELWGEALGFGGAFRDSGGTFMASGGPLWLWGGSLACRRDGFLSFHTSKYRLHYYETPTGLRLVLNTDLSVASAREALHHIYSNVSGSWGGKYTPQKKISSENTLQKIPLPNTAPEISPLKYTPPKNPPSKYSPPKYTPEIQSPKIHPEKYPPKNSPPPNASPQI